MYNHKRDSKDDFGVEITDLPPGTVWSIPAALLDLGARLLSRIREIRIVLGSSGIEEEEDLSRFSVWVTDIPEDELQSESASIVDGEK